MSEYNHYVRIENNLVTYGFSDAFEQPITSDLKLTGDFGRHFQIQLTNEHGQYIYKIENGQMALRDRTELDTEWQGRPPDAPSLQDQVNSMSAALLSLMGL